MRTLLCIDTGDEKMGSLGYSRTDTDPPDQEVVYEAGSPEPLPTNKLGNGIAHVGICDGLMGGDGDALAHQTVYEKHSLGWDPTSTGEIRRK